MRFWSVSYTHLDVYKRQALYWAVSQIMQIGFNIHLSTVRKKMKREAEEKRLMEKAKKK